MGRGPSVVACPEERGKGGGGERGTGPLPSQHPPNSSLRTEATLPAQVLGLHRPWPVVWPLECTILERPLGAVSLTSSGHLHPIIGMGGILRLRVGKGRDGDGVKESNGRERL